MDRINACRVRYGRPHAAGTPMNSLRRLWAAVAVILLGGPVDAAPWVAYDSTNFVSTGDAGYGYLGVTTLDKRAIYGDSLHLTAIGKLTSFTWAAYNGPASTDLTSASQTISFYRQSNASLIGSFNATITDLGKGSYKTFTADLTSANIVLDTPDILVTQQIPFWPPASPTYRLGIVISASSNTPVIGTTGTGYYRSAFGSQGAFLTDGSAPNYSSAVYRAVVLPNLTWNTTSGTWNASAANWTFDAVGGSTWFSDGDQATFDNAAGGIVQLSGALAPRAVAVSATSGQYVFYSLDGNNQLTGAATLSKSGAGTLFLYGPNTYSGVTTVSGGRLLVQGSLTNSAVTVGSGGALGGAGSIGSAVSVAIGGTLAPGASIESLSTGTATFAAGASFAYEVDSSDPLALGSAADLLVVSGNLNLDTGNGTILTVADLAGSPNAFADNTTIFALINYSGTWNGGLFTYGGTPLADGGTFTVGTQQWLIDYDAPAGATNFTGDYLPGSSFVTITAVPEPATYAMALAGLACGGCFMWRRRKRA
ncbi:MAG: autotransporter-associated beta strand repeat-containing protein [Planctomycetaceae bacterium]